MAQRHAELVIRTLNGRHGSVDDQVTSLHGMVNKNIGPNHEGVRRSNLESTLGVSLSHQAETVLENLVDIDLVEKDPEDFDDLRTYAIAEWLGNDGEIVNGEVEETAEDGLENLIQHMQDTDPTTGGSPAVTDGAGTTVRSVLSNSLGVAPNAVENHLRSGDAVANLREAVTVIENHPDLSTRSDYGKIIFRNEAYRYRLTDTAITLYRL